MKDNRHFGVAKGEEAMEVDEVLVRGCGVCQCPLILEWCGLGFFETWSYFQGATPKNDAVGMAVLWNCNDPNCR
jgi:hypothetical protein